MSIQFTITISGQDRPQLIKQLAASTHSLGGKWLASKITRLDQQVAGIIRIQIPDAAAEELKQQFNTLSELHIRVAENTGSTPSQGIQIKLKVESEDRPGIINDITHILDEIGIDIIHIENQRLAVQELGQTMFVSELALDVPGSVSAEQLVDAVQLVDDGFRVEVVK